MRDDVFPPTGFNVKNVSVKDIKRGMVTGT